MPHFETITNEISHSNSTICCSLSLVSTYHGLKIAELKSLVFQSFALIKHVDVEFGYTSRVCIMLSIIMAQTSFSTTFALQDDLTLYQLFDCTHEPRIS